MVKFEKGIATSYLRVSEERADVNFCSMDDILRGFAQAGFIFDKTKKIMIVTWRERDERNRVIEGGDSRDYMLIGEFNDKGNLIPGTNHVRMGISEKIDFKPGMSAVDKFKDIYQNHVVFFGKSAVDNRPYLTAAPQGNGERAKPESFDFAALLSKDINDNGAPKALTAKERKAQQAAMKAGLVVPGA